MTSNAVVVSDVSKSFRIYRDRNRSLKATVLKRSRAKYEEFWALKDIDLEIPQGKTFGLLGNNGSGKSTLLKCIAQILEPNKGSIRHVGRMAAMLEVGSGFHPELSGRDNVYLNGAILGMSKAEIDKKFDSIVDFSGVEDFIDQPVKNYSSGMYVRLGFSVSIHVEPDILLVDEVLAVGDMAFQEKCTEKFADLRREGRTVVVVSHAIEQMRTFCDQAAWLHHGQLMGVGPANDIITEYADQAHNVHQRAVTTPDGRVVSVENQAGGRYGNGKATIERVELLDAGGEDVRRVRTGDEVRLRMHYSCAESIENAEFGFAFEHESGFVVWGHNTIDSGWDIPTLQPGRGTVDLVIPSIPLRPGVFIMQAGLSSDRNARTHDYLPRALTFTVASGQPLESIGVAVMHSHFENLRQEP
ncbi:MAG: ABC transporter ATP-binding protein [Propionibacteriaceae bacterium]